jgi:hypothetical protein
MPSHRFFAFAERLIFYAGSLQARAREERENQSQGTPTTPQPRTQQRDPAVPAGTHPSAKIEYTDDGRRIVDGVALDSDGVPSWVRNRGKPTGQVEVIPGTPGALAMSPAFAGQFSYAAVKA